MKKCKKQAGKRQQRSKRSSKKGIAGAIPSLGSQIRAGLLAEIQKGVARLAAQLVEDEVLELVGAPWSRKGDSALRRGGRTKSRIYLDGEPLLLDRQRVRDLTEGKEVVLSTVRALQDHDALDEDVKRLMVRGVSTRDYDEALGTISDGLGLKKSAVSAAFQKASQKDLDSIDNRSLLEWKFAALYIDGTGFKDHLCIVVMGITEDGHKHILGVRDGATENAELVGDMLDSLLKRGLTLTPHALFVLDGSAALKKAVKKRFGAKARIQRCIIHKERNVLSYLPEEHTAEARRRLRAAWNMNGYDTSKKALLAVHRWLQRLNSRAASSLMEGLEDTLTVQRLGVGATLRRTLSTTNPIESVMDRIKTLTRRVKRWRNGAMVMRWVGSGLVRVEASFRRVKGHDEMPQFLASLERLALQDSKDVA